MRSKPLARAAGSVLARCPRHGVLHIPFGDAELRQLLAYRVRAARRSGTSTIRRPSSLALKQSTPRNDVNIACPVALGVSL